MEHTNSVRLKKFNSRHKVLQVSIAMNALLLLISIYFYVKCVAQEVFESDMNFRIEPGALTCFFEKGKAGQTMEAQYQVIDGQHGDLDISFEIRDPNGVSLVSDYKKSHNAIIMELEVDGDYVFCMDNSFSLMNSKLVFVYVLVEDRPSDAGEAVVSNGNEDEEILEWVGYYPNGENYTVEVTKLAGSLTRTLSHVVKARRQLDVYAALKSRDSYLAIEDIFIVDVWSAFQIAFMCLVGLLQVYMIKKLFNKTTYL